MYHLTWVDCAILAALVTAMAVLLAAIALSGGHPVLVPVDDGSHPSPGDLRSDQDRRGHQRDLYRPSWFYSSVVAASLIVLSVVLVATR